MALLLSRVMPPVPCFCEPALPAACSASASASSASRMSDRSQPRSQSASPPSAASPLSASSLSSASFSAHSAAPAPPCPAHCHTASCQSQPASLTASPRSSSESLSGRSTSPAPASAASALPVPAAVERLFPTYQSIYPASSLPQMHDARTITELFKQDGFTEVFQWQDGPSTAYDAHTHPTCNAHYIFRGDLHVSYPQLGQSVYYKQGDRFDIPAELVHSTNMGQQGCVYMVGSKRQEPRK